MAAKHHIRILAFSNTQQLSNGKDDCSSDLCKRGESNWVTVLPQIMVSPVQTPVST